MQVIKSVLVAALLLKLACPKHDLLSRLTQQDKRMRGILLIEINSFTYIFAQEVFLVGNFFFVCDDGLRLKSVQHLRVVDPEHCFMVSSKHCLLQRVLAHVSWWLLLCCNRPYRCYIFSWAAGAQFRLYFGRKAFVVATVLNWDSGMLALHVFAESTSSACKRCVFTPRNFTVRHSCLVGGVGGVTSQASRGHLGCWQTRGSLVSN